MGTVVLDTSVVLALLNEDDVHNESATTSVRKVPQDDRVVSAIVYAEVMVGVRRSKRSVLIKKSETFFKVVPRSIEPVTTEIASVAADIRTKNLGIKLPDALIIATAEALNADRLLTFDKRWRRVSKRVEVLS